MNLQDMSKLDRELLQYVLESELDLAISEYRELEEDSVLESILMESNTEKEEKKSKLKEKINKIGSFIKTSVLTAFGIVITPIAIALSAMSALFMNKSTTKSASKNDKKINELSKNDIFYINKKALDCLDNELKILQKLESTSKKLLNEINNDTYAKEITNQLNKMIKNRNYKNSSDIIEITGDRLFNLIKNYEDIYEKLPSYLELNSIDYNIQANEINPITKKKLDDSIDENYFDNYIRNITSVVKLIQTFSLGNYSLIRKSFLNKDKKNPFNDIKLEKKR